VRASRRSRTPSHSTSRWAARPTRSCTCSPSHKKPVSPLPWPTSIACRAKCPPLQGRAVVRLPRGRRAPRGRHLHHPRRARSRGSIHRNATTVHARTLGEAIDDNDLRRKTATVAAKKRALAAPGGVRTQVAFSQDKYFAEHDMDAGDGCIRDAERAYSATAALWSSTGTLRAKAAS